MSNASKYNPKLLLRMLILGASTFIYATPYIIWTFYMPLFNAFNVDYARFGLLMTVYGFVALPAYFFGGWFADKFDPAKLVGISLVGSGILGFWYSTLPSFNVVLVIQFFLAILTIGLFWNSVLKLIKLMSADLGEGKGYATWELFRKFANFGLAALEIMVFTQYGEGQTGLAAALVFNSVVVIVLGILTFVAYRGENLNDAVEKEEGEEISFGLIIPLLKKPVIWMIGLIIMLVYIPSAMQGNLSAYCIAVLGMSEAQGAWVVQFGQLAPLVVLPFAGWIADKVGSAKAVLIMLIATLASTIFMIAVPGNAAYVMPAIVSILLFFAMIIGVRGIYYSLVGWAGIPNLIAGTALGVISFIAFSPDLYIYNLAGSFLDADPIGGYMTIFYMMAASLALAIVMIVVLMNYCKNKSAVQLFGDVHNFKKEA